MDQFLGEVRLFSFFRIPKGWLPCDGRLLPINQNQALFSLLSTIYGGDGQSTFGLPDLRGRVPVGVGTGGGQSYTIAQKFGTESVQLTLDNLPAHSHPAYGSASQVSTGTPGDAVTLGTFPIAQNYVTAGPTTQMNSQAISSSGGSQPHSNLQPYLALNVCISIQGIFPSHN